MFNDQAELLTSSVLSAPGRDSESRRINRLLGRGVERQTPRSGKPPTEQESRLVSHFAGEAERSRSYLYSFHRQWFINIAACLGSSGVRTEAVAKALKVNVKTNSSRVNHNSNNIGGYVRRLVGYLSRSNPDISFVPSDVQDPLQVDYARGARKWLDWQWTYDAWKKKRLEVLNWAISVGWGISKAVFDATGGPRCRAIDENGETITGRDGKPMLGSNGKPRLYQTGMAHTVVVPPFHYIFGIAARSDEELSWNGEDSWMSFRYLESLYPGIVKEFGLVPEPQFTSNSALYERQILMTVGPSAAYATGGQETSEAGCGVRQVFVAPYYLDPSDFGDEMYEQGAFLLFAQGKKLVLEPNRLLELEGVNPRMDWNPYTIWPCFSVPGRLVPQGLPDNVIPVQEAKNFIISRQRETQRMMGTPKWFVQRNSINQPINNETALQIEYGVGFNPPMAWTPPPQPAYIMQLVEWLQSDEERIASQPPMMQGQAQGQIRSAMGVNLLQEQALTQFTPMVEAHSWALARHTRQLLLREIQEGDTLRRIPRRTGSGEWEQELFYAKHMNPEFMVRITPGSEMPINKAVEMANLDRMVAWQRLIPSIPQHADVIDRVMGYDIPNYSPDDTESAMSKAREENWLLLEQPGEPTPTYSFFNHRVHINEHMRFLNSQRAQAKIKEEVQRFGFSPFLDRIMEMIGRHKGFLLALQQGIVMPQPIPDFEDMSVEGHMMQQQGQGAGGGLQQQLANSGVGGRPGAFTGTGSQNGFARPPGPGDMGGGMAPPAGAGLGVPQAAASIASVPAIPSIQNSAPIPPGQ